MTKSAIARKPISGRQKIIRADDNIIALFYTVNLAQVDWLGLKVGGHWRCFCSHSVNSSTMTAPYKYSPGIIIIIIIILR